VLGVEWEHYPIIGGIVVIVVVVGGLVIRAIMPIKFEVTVHDRKTTEAPPPSGEDDGAS
jgi:hypothetical protein